MAIWIALIAALCAAVAARILTSEDEPSDTEIAAACDEIASLRKKIEERLK